MWGSIFVGQKYPTVKLNTSYSFGLDDNEFVVAFETDYPQSCGILELDERGVVTGFHEKVQNSPGNIANGAIYILSDKFI